MRTSQFFLATLKETPADAEIISHQLMLRAGMIRRTAAGIYSWLPMGHRVLKKVENIIREEMNRAGALEVFLPAVQPAELWRESGRWQDYGPELLRFQDRHERDFCLGPTHEEVITMIAKGEIKSYRQLPVNMYQIQTKFRDEIRPRFGVMRGREFIMKDAYSFDIDADGMEASYKAMYDAYVRIFDRLGLDSRAVRADGGTIGGSFSNEFHVIADSGEDAIALCEDCGYAANVEMVPTPAPGIERPNASETMDTVDTPSVHTIEELCVSLKVGAEKTVKTLIVEGEGGLVALVLRGDHELNAVKAENLPEVKTPLKFANNADIKSIVGAEAGSVGPVGLSIPVVADSNAALLSDFVCGANQDEKHSRGVNWVRDLPEPKVADLRKAVAGDPCPQSPNNKLIVKRGIEVGHVFQLGTKYSESMDATCLNEQGKSVPLHMGCYGIGVTRVVAAAIEQNHDENGITWPAPIAPFDVCIVPIGYKKSEKVRDSVSAIYEQLTDAGYEILLDDRDERPGVMFANMDLIGIPHRLVIGERGLENGVVEYRARRRGETEDIALADLVEKITSMVNGKN
ncbi:MAG: proline--tRNA ligase [Gammaproteobacteria bacterium]|nr:proline--tRNA ligase [Gammaproteobacteria bacterium]